MGSWPLMLHLFGDKVVIWVLRIGGCVGLLVFMGLLDFFGV